MAVATRNLAQGTTIISVPALTTVLLPEAKGRRCDSCHRAQSDVISLRKCTGCGSYWYCGINCQNRQWKAHHRKLCKFFNQYMTSMKQELNPLQPELMDAQLLSHLVAEHLPSGTPTRLKSNHDLPASSPLSIFFSLLPLHLDEVKAPPICPMTGTPTLSLPDLNDIYSRFANNNFVVHSHLVPYAHGIFPMASRLFNHSCTPNSAAKYVFTSDVVRLDVVALRDISDNEEITIPYLDPALPLHTRQQSLQHSYGFTCICQLCTYQSSLGIIPAPTKVDALGNLLCKFVFPDFPRTFQAHHSVLDQLPNYLISVFHESYLPYLSELFSQTSHDGSYGVALNAGLKLLALYTVVYPSNYPQIGMHALELAKTTWNTLITIDPYKMEVQDLMQAYLAIANQVLGVFGLEGDVGGPQQEIKRLEQLLDE